MDIIEAMQKRHSVRSYLDKPIAADLREKLQAEIKSCNAEGGLNFQLVTDEERAFGGLMANYGKFSGVKNYIADGRVQAKPGAGFYTKLDLGIVKCHFELGSGKDGSIWA